MKDSPTFAERLTPDTINRLERAAQHRYESANVLWKEKRRLAALYMFGYTAEICLSTAYFRCRISRRRIGIWRTRSSSGRSY